MVAIKQIVHEIESLPAEYFHEIMDFVGYLKLKHLKNIPDTMILSEEALAKDWDTFEEDEIWKDL